jgi:hypothetical protein
MSPSSDSRRYLPWLSAAIAGSSAILGLITVLAIAGTPGSAGDTTADVVFGQPDFFHTMINFGGRSALWNPQGLAIDSSNHVYVADTYNYRVLGWKTAAEFSSGAPADIVLGQPDFFSSFSGPSEFSSSSSGCGTICSPTAIAVDPAGNVYVANQLDVVAYSSPFSSGMTEGEPVYQTLPITGTALACDSFGNLQFRIRSPIRCLGKPTTCSAMHAARALTACACPRL